MVRVAQEMERRGLSTPLLIGGATTSAAHTAVRIAPAYAGPVVHVPDASRAAAIATRLASPERRDEAAREARETHDRLRREHVARMAATKLVPLHEARRRALVAAADGGPPPLRTGDGAVVRVDVGLATLAGLIDWTPFFQAWELRGRYPSILSDPTLGDAARSSSRTRRRCSRRWRRIRAAARWGSCRLPRGPRGGRRHRALRSRGGESAPARRPPDAPRSRPWSIAAAPCLALADFVARRGEGRADTVGRVRRDGGTGLRRGGQRVRGGSRRLPLDPREGARRSLRRGDDGVDASVRAGGVGAPRRTDGDHGRTSLGAVSRHPTGARVSGLPRPRRQGDDPRTPGPGGRRARGGAPHRDLRARAGGDGVRLDVPARPRRATSRSGASEGTRWATTRAGAARTSPRSRRGCARGSATRRRRRDARGLRRAPASARRLAPDRAADQEQRDPREEHRDREELAPESIEGSDAAVSPMK